MTDKTELSEKNYLDGVDIIYWINLDRAKDRKKYMENIFKDPIFKNIKIKRVSAVDAKKTSEMFDMLDIKLHKMRDAEYACSLSHLETIREFSKTNYENALIFEDDLSLEYKKYWEKTIQEIIDGAPKDWEILKLMCYRWNPYKKLYNKWKHRLGSNANNDMSTIGYLINNKAAKKLTKDLYHNNKYVFEANYQHQSDGLLYQKLRTYVYKYPLFTYKNKNDTQIQLNEPLNHKKNIITRFLKNSFKKNKTKKIKQKK